ncbi:MAG: hypothetical protein KGH98_04340 [Candidatus Micrarchaeota archaeon]|nr:hypothetical protein [Candidatus Micrarchaeota archaeon]
MILRNSNGEWYASLLSITNNLRKLEGIERISGKDLMDRANLATQTRTTTETIEPIQFKELVKKLEESNYVEVRRESPDQDVMGAEIKITSKGIAYLKIQGSGIA